MIEIVYKENKEQANGNEGYFHLPKNIRQVGDTTVSYTHLTLPTKLEV